VSNGLVGSVATVATSARTGRSVVFVQSATTRAHHRSHAVAYAVREGLI